MTDGVTLSTAEQHDLEILAKNSVFFGRLRAAYAEWDSLTPRQYEALSEARKNMAWQKNAVTVAGVLVRNRYLTTDGEPLCGHRGKPSCRAEATVVIGGFGYCEAHVDSAKESFAAWKKDNPRKETTKIGGGVGNQVTPPQKSSCVAPEDRMDSFLDTDIDDVPF